MSLKKLRMLICRFLDFSPDGIDEVDSRLGNKYPCHAGLWQTCCPSGSEFYFIHLEKCALCQFSKK